MSKDDIMTASEAAIPFKMKMDAITFRRWLAEVQGIQNPEVEDCNPPAFRIDEPESWDMPYISVEVYCGTTEGTVTAYHSFEGVKVVVDKSAPTPSLRSLVRGLMDEARTDLRKKIA